MFLLALSANDIASPTSFNNLTQGLINRWGLAPKSTREKGDCFQNRTAHRGCLEGHSAQERWEERADRRIFSQQLLILLGVFGWTSQFPNKCTCLGKRLLRNLFVHFLAYQRIGMCPIEEHQ